MINDGEDEDEHRLVQESIQRFVVYLTEVTQSGSVEVYLVWAGDEHKMPGERFSLRVDELSEGHFEVLDFDIRRFLMVSPV